LGINPTQPDPKRRFESQIRSKQIRIMIISSLRRYQIRSLIKDQSPIRTLTAVLDQLVGVLIQV